jgi:nucleoid-associated protein YgaU
MREIKTQTTRTTTVQPGDTLYAIAREVYGKGSMWPVIWEANRAQMGLGGISTPSVAYDSSFLHPGMELILPQHPLINEPKP